MGQDNMKDWIGINGKENNTKRMMERGMGICKGWLGINGKGLMGRERKICRGMEKDK